ncbi:unnamed protein product [Phytomonas sp. Hart1]|nr:unnamed protein product [Phytomonas sp. Hart1]|eukprot:CCW66901.1 unnamed protein product [Phytomonas sp. isolate Hart1]
MLLAGVGITFFSGLLDDVSERFQDNLDSTKVGGMQRGGLQSILSSTEMKPVNLENLETTFEDIRGCDEAKRELQEIVEFLKDPGKFHDLGSRLPKGVLLVGPPPAEDAAREGHRKGGWGEFLLRHRERIR